MADIELVQGDRHPSPRVQLVDEDGTAIDLTAATSVTVTMAPKYGTSPAVFAALACTIVTAASGQVEFDWPAASTDTPGDYWLRWTVTWLTGREQTWPPAGGIHVAIAADLPTT